MVVVNPPYGERLGEASALPALYTMLGPDSWPSSPAGTLSCSPTTTSSQAAGMRGERRHRFYNGALACRLLAFTVPRNRRAAIRGAEIEPGGELAGARARPMARSGDGCVAFANRLRKNVRIWRVWARRSGVTCYRVYDADLPDYAVAIDRYERFVVVQEYEAPSEIDPRKAARRLQDVAGIVPELLEVKPADLS